MVSSVQRLQAQQRALKIPSKTPSGVSSLRLQQEALKTGKKVAQIKRENQIEQSEAEFKELSKKAQSLQQQFKGLSVNEYEAEYQRLDSKLKQFFKSPSQIKAEQQQEISQTIQQTEQKIQQAQTKKREVEKKYEKIFEEYEDDKQELKRYVGMGGMTNDQYNQAVKNLKKNIEQREREFREQKDYWNSYISSLRQGVTELEAGKQISYKNIESFAEKVARQEEEKVARRFETQLKRKAIERKFEQQLMQPQQDRTLTVTTQKIPRTELFYPTSTLRIEKKDKSGFEEALDEFKARQDIFSVPEQEKPDISELTQPSTISPGIKPDMSILQIQELPKPKDITAEGFTGEGSFTKAVYVGKGKIQDYLFKYKNEKIVSYEPISTKVELSKDAFFFDYYKTKERTKGFQPAVVKKEKPETRDKYFYEEVAGFGKYIFSGNIPGFKDAPFFTAGAGLVLSETKKAGQKVGELASETKTPQEVASDLLKDTGVSERITEPEKDKGFFEKRFEDVTGITFSRKIFEKQQFLEKEDRTIGEDITKTLIEPSAQYVQDVATPIVSPLKDKNFINIFGSIGEAKKIEEKKEKDIKKIFSEAEKQFKQRQEIVKKINQLNYPTIKKFNTLVEQYEKETNINKKQELAEKITKLQQTEAYKNEVKKLETTDKDLRNKLVRIEDRLRFLGFRKTETEEGKSVWNNVLVTEQTTKRLRKDFLNKKTSEPFTSFFFRKLKFGVSEAFTDIAMYGTEAFTTDVERVEPTPTAKTIGDIGSILSVDIPSYTLPGVRSVRILGGSTEKLIQGELVSYAREEPLEVAFAGAFLGTKTIKGAIKYGKKFELYALSKQKPIYDVTYQTTGKQPQLVSLSRRELRLGGLVGQPKKGLLFAQSKTVKFARIGKVDKLKSGEKVIRLFGGKGETITKIRSGGLFGAPETYKNQFGFFSEPFTNIRLGKPATFKTPYGTTKLKQTFVGEIDTYKIPRRFEDKLVGKLFTGVYAKSNKLGISGTTPIRKLYRPDLIFEKDKGLLFSDIIVRKGTSDVIRFTPRQLKESYTFFGKTKILKDLPTYKPYKDTIFMLPKSSKQTSQSIDDIAKKFTEIAKKNKDIYSITSGKTIPLLDTVQKTQKGTVTVLPPVEQLFRPEVSQSLTTSFAEVGTGTAQAITNILTPQTETSLKTFTTSQEVQRPSMTLSTFDMTKTDDFVATDTRQLSKTLTSPATTTRPKSVTTQQPVTRQVPATQPVVSPVTAPYIPPSAPSTTTPVSPISFDFDKFRPKTKKPKKDKSYHLLIKSKGKYRKATKKPMRKSTAQNIGSYIVDNSLSAEFKLRKSAKKPVKPQLFAPLNYWNNNRKKFRTYRFRKKRKIPIKNVFIEKKQHRLDTRNEVNKITSQRLLKSSKNIFGKPIMKVKNNNPKKSYAPTKSLYKIFGF